MSDETGSVSANRLRTDRAKKPYIPRIWGYFLYLLAGECQSDHLGMKPGLPLFEECESPVKVAATHADTVILLIERDDRRDHDVEHARRDDYVRYEQEARDARRGIWRTP